MRPILSATTPNHPWVRRLWGAVPETEWRDWRWQWRQRLTLPADCATLFPSETSGAGRAAAAARYPMSVTPYYLALCDPDDPADPLLRQWWPDAREQADATVAADPLGEGAAMVVPGLIRRYADRAVVLATSTCAVYCRHCTRKNFLREPAPAASRTEWQRIVDALAGLPEVREVIVSGGDPLLLDLDLLDWLLGALRRVPHVEVLRVGTRLPVVMPMRMDDALCACLAAHRPLWVNTQFNHPRELTAESIAACDRLQRAGLPVSNQTVLLRGVNDDLETLVALCRGLQRGMVRPYYLFHCDPVRGATHFQTSLAEGRALYAALRARVGGLCLPHYVMDVPGAAGKVPLLPGAGCPEDVERLACDAAAAWKPGADPVETLQAMRR